MRGHANFDPQAWERVIARLERDVPQLSRCDAERLLRAARVERPKTLNQVDAYLAGNADPDAVVAAPASCPRGLLRLTHLLAAEGLGVSAPACTNCARRVPLRWSGTTGRICGRCFATGMQFTCQRCGSQANGYGSWSSGVLLCRGCVGRDQASLARCDTCGRLGPRAHRLTDGKVLCPTCAPKLIRECAQCHRIRHAPHRIPEGYLCKNCYSWRTRSWTCGICGVARRRQGGTGFGPHLCGDCRKTLLSLPSRFGAPRTRLGERECAFCHRLRRSCRTWPGGPVCPPCSSRAMRYPSDCAECGEKAVLIGMDSNGGRICGPCSGSTLDFRCTECGGAGIRSGGLCSRCYTANQLRDAFAGPDGEVFDQLKPLVKALSDADDPRSVAVWLSKSAAAWKLRELASAGTEITHATLDELPASPSLNYIREILVRTRILEIRNEPLERIEPWLEQLLLNYPREHARIVRSYGMWYLVHRARRSKRPVGASGGARIRTRIRVSLEFLEWLKDRGQDLDTMEQGDVDKWLAQGGSRRKDIRQFLHWTASRHLTSEVSAPAVKHAPPSTFVEEAVQLDRLNRCLNDDTLDTDVRAAGALILLFGMMTVRVLALRKDQIIARDGNHYLKLNAHELILPSRLAALLNQLPAPRPRSTLPDSTAPDMLLFPGRTPDRPVNAGQFGQRLKQIGIAVRGGRNTAFLGLAAELPAPVVADLLAVDIVTATRWAHYAKREWGDYLAARRGH